MPRHHPPDDLVSGRVRATEPAVARSQLRAERHSHATTPVRNGDPTAFIEELSRHDPVTLFPASQPGQKGWEDVSQAIRRVASAYSSSKLVEFDVVSAGLSGDLA